MGVIRLFCKIFALALLLVCGAAHSSQGQTIFIPIGVGDVTTFIPIMPAPASGQLSDTYVDGQYYLHWESVSGTSYYQVIIIDEKGIERIIEVSGNSHSLANFELGTSTVKIKACNRNDQCGVTYTIGTVSRTSKVNYQHTDMLGSVIAESDSSASITSRSHYEPFGKRMGGDKPGIGYTGHLQDEDLGLTYMQARYYDPLIGRFYADDPLAFRDVHSFNRYAYANNNPYKYTDPDGKASRKEFGGAAAKVAIGVAYTSGKIDRDTADEMIASIEGKVGKPKNRSSAKRRAARAAQRKKENPRVAVSQPSTNVQGDKYGVDNLRGQQKVGMDGKTKIGIQDGSKDSSNNNTDHKPAIDVGNLKDGQQPGDNGQPRIKNEHKVKEDI